MIRFENQLLPQRPRIAVLANDAIGNFVMATPLLQLLRSEWNPASIAYFGGRRTRELQEASDLFESSHLLHGASATEFASFVALAGSFDFIVNLESTALAKTLAGLLAGEETLVAGPSIAPGGRGDLAFGSDPLGRLWQDRHWARENLPRDYPFLRTGFIGEIFCRLCGLEGEIPGYLVPKAPPGRAIPDVLIATAASLPEKLWPRWRELVVRIRQRGLSVGLLGAAPAAQKALWIGGEAESELIGPDCAEDLRGTLTLPQVVGALAEAKAVVSLDNGILHLAVAAGSPKIGLFRHGIHHLWAPPSPNLTVLTPGEGAEVSQIEIEHVLEALERRLG